MADSDKIKKSGGNSILAFFLGVLMGIIFLVGSFAGVGYFAWKSSIKSTLKIIDRGENGKIYQMLFDEEDGFLAPSYAEKKVGDLIKDLTTAVKSVSGDGALADFGNISPKVGSIVDKLLKTTGKYEIPLDKEELMAKSFGELADYITAQLEEAPLGGLIKGINGAESTEPLLLALCYGQEGVDYCKNDDGEIVMLGDAKKTTINGLFGDGGVSELMDKVTLESVSGEFNKDDPIMRAIAYGAANRYELSTDDEGNTVVTMKQITFTCEDGKWYDIDGEEIACTFDGSKLVCGEETYYLTTTNSVTYLAYTDEECEQAALYPKTKINDLMSDASSLVDGLYLSDALNVTKDSHQILISLAYGEKDVDYEIVDEEIVPINPQRTITDLKKDSGTLIDGILLADALGIDESSNAVLRSIAYDDKGNPISLGELSEKSDEIIKGIYLDEAIGVSPTMHPVLKSIIVEGVEGIDYEIVEDGDGGWKIVAGSSGKVPVRRTLQNLSEKSDDIIGGILLKDALKIDDSSHAVLRAIAVDPATGESRTLNELSERSGEIIDGILLADALSVTVKSSRLLITLAYGKGYQINEEKITPADGKEPRTLGGLTNNFGDYLNEVALADIITPTDDSPIIMYLLYGREDVHYSYENEKLMLLQQQVGISDADEDEDAYNAYGEVWKDADVDKENKTLTVDGKTYKYDTTTPVREIDGGVKYYYLFEADGVTKVMYEARTIEELSGENNAISMLTERLTIKEILGEDATQDNIFLKHVQDETISSLPNAIVKLSIAKVYEDEVYDEQNNLKGTWSYLLTDQYKVKKPEDYTVENFDEMIGNMTHNMQNASLNQLQADGIISGMNEDVLSQDIKTNFGFYNLETHGGYKKPDKETIGELTVTELFEYVSALLKISFPAN